MDSGGGWLRVHPQRPGMLLLRRLGPGEPRGVAVAMFGHSGLGMLICRIESGLSLLGRWSGWVWSWRAWRGVLMFGYRWVR
jgi:hypothetical protein